MQGIIQDDKHVYKRNVAVMPVVHCYQEVVTQIPYQKFTCPVCEAVGNQNIGLTYGVDECPLCGVHLNWVRYPEVGDEVVLTTDVADLKAGTRGVLVDMIHSEPKLCLFRVNGETHQLPLEWFSVLVREES